MEKAYDVKALVKYAKAEGLEVAEEAAKGLYRALRQWIEDSAKLSENPYDDLGIPFLKQIDAIAMKELEDINPHDNPTEENTTPDETA